MALIGLDILIFFSLRRDGITTTHPACQIYVRAAARAKRAKGGNGLALADWATHASTSLSGNRARLRCNS